MARHEWSWRRDDEENDTTIPRVFHSETRYSASNHIRLEPDDAVANGPGASQGSRVDKKIDNLYRLENDLVVDQKEKEENDEEYNTEGTRRYGSESNLTRENLEGNDVPIHSRNYGVNADNESNILGFQEDNTGDVVANVGAFVTERDNSYHRDSDGLSNRRERLNEDETTISTANVVDPYTESLVGFQPDDAVAIGPGASQSGRIENKIDNLYSIEYDHVYDADVVPLSIDTEEENKTRGSCKKRITISSVFSVITILAVGLSVGLSQRNNKGIDQTEIMSCGFVNITEIDHLPVGWKSCICNNDRKVDVPESHLSKYEYLKERFIENSILPVDFDIYIDVCDVRNIALFWLAEDMIENNKEKEDNSTIKRFSLVLLYLSTVDNNPLQWTDNTGWMTSEPECNWTGIWCNGTNPNGEQMFSISLHENNLDGSIPSEISLLAEVVTAINISRNKFSGSIPSEIGLLTKLTSFSLRRDYITDIIPTEIGLLSELETLDFSDNSISGTIPIEIGRLTKLNYFSIGENIITGIIPTEIGLLTVLKRLHLEENFISGIIPTEIGNLESLLIFQSSYNQLTGTIPSSIGLCTSLENLTVSINGISGAIPKEIGQLQNITVLDFNTNKLTGIPSTIGLCTSLEDINLRYNRISGTIPTELGSLYNLKRLYLGSNYLNGTIPTELGNCRNLIHVEVDYNWNLEGMMPSEFGKLSNLERLFLCQTGLTEIAPEQICPLLNGTKNVWISWGYFC